jgi:hypothetical protein
VIDGIVGGVVKTGKKLWGKAKDKLKGRGKKGGKGDVQARLVAAKRDADRVLGESASPQEIKSKLPSIKARHKLTSIELQEGSEDDYSIEVTINPKAKTKPKKLSGKKEKVLEDLNALGLGQDAIDRVTLKTGVSQIKGQLMEELIDLDLLRKLGVAAKGAVFLEGHRIKDAHGRQLTDGIVAVKKGNELHIQALVEVKSGPGAAAGLRSERTPREDQDLKYAVDLLRQRDPRVRGRSSAELEKSHARTLQSIMEKELSRVESGQVRRTLERTIPSVRKRGTVIEVDGKQMLLVGASASTLVLAFLPKDLVSRTLTPKAMRQDHGILNFKVERISLTVDKLGSLAKRVAAARFGRGKS